MKTKVHSKEDAFLPIETGFNLMLKDLDNLQKENDAKIAEMQKVLKAMVGRELKMTDLKGEIHKLETMLAACRVSGK